ncbi:putative biopolymer transport protein, ExbB family [Methylophaga frappieri]|uniref:Putative biopolymer transport protein, ExbB family n=1 Tax=Methylophaga frappieri (strain ATCC BAA-2434 / DSM 25690 / JAM7) TaxID=754477 RepID=I1YLA6_METFJ|nr:MotA/TolQ/ExbB proton channel family protein [Methylophaga frappieri]AFJ03699.1 putative biopolymer transport protein, ExbB family [Methylophaga frappieri]
MNEMLKSFAALVVAIVIVHMVYLGYIRPEAAQYIAIGLEQQQSLPRNFVVIVKGYEQEICFILMLWGCYLIASAYRRILKTQYLYSVDLIETTESNDSALDVNQIIDRLDTEIPKEGLASPLVQTLRAALWRYSATNNVQNLSDAIESNLEALAVRQDTENTMIRYLIWAIPSIGFIGTVRGIGQALSQADEALAGNIAGMVDSLGLAFNSTLVALLISIFLMFLFHQLQRLQDGQIVETQHYCDKYLLRRIR